MIINNYYVLIIIVIRSIILLCTVFQSGIWQIQRMGTPR